MTDIVPNHSLTIDDQDLLEELLRDKRSPNTRRTYNKALREFFITMTQFEPTPEAVGWFLSLERFSAIALVLRYKAQLLERGLTPATINVRLSAVKSLVNYARKVGKCSYSLEDVEGLKAEIYRDTSGVTVDGFKRIINQFGGDSLKNKRDTAILRLLWDNALRRAEVCSLNIEDYEPSSSRLWIKGKGRASKEPIGLSSKAVDSINDWLVAVGSLRDATGSLRGRSPDKPLFCTLDRATFGHRLSGNAIYTIVRNAAESAGIERVISPHRIRHSAITAALDATNGNTRKVQKLSRHRNLNTLMIYDDNRQQHQAEVTGILADLV